MIATSISASPSQVRGERLLRCPARLRAKDGSIRHVQITSNANFGEMGFKNTRCFTVDVTDEVAAMAAARQTEQKARDILDALPSAIYTTDAEARRQSPSRDTHPKSDQTNGA